MSETEQQAASIESGLRTRYLLQSPVVVLATTTIVALLGGTLLALAAEWSHPLVGLCGVVIATGAAWVTTDYTAARWREVDNRSWKSFVIAAALIGLAALLMAGRLRSDLGVAAPILAFLGLMALTLVIGPVVGGVRDGAVGDADRWMRDGLVVGFLSAVVIGSPVTTWIRLIAFITLLGGFGFLTGGLSTMCAHGALPTSRVLRIIPGDARQRGIVVGGTGLGILLVGVIVSLNPVTAVGSWLTIVAMIMLSVRPVRFGMSTLMKRSVLGAGLVLVAVAGYQLYATDTVGRSGWFATFVALTIALVGAWIVWRGATLFIVVVVGFAFVWGLFPHTVADPHHVTADTGDDMRTSGIVAFGDSFMSGEGAPDFFAGTDQKGADQNECRRSPTAYPVLLADENDESDVPAVSELTEPGLDFYACSGAKLRDVLALCADNPALDAENEEARELEEGPQVEAASLDVPAEIAEIGEIAEDEVETNDEDRCVVETKELESHRRAQLSCEPAEDLPLGQYPCGPSDVYGSTLQVANLPEDRSRTQLVLLSIGGNDVRFGDIVAGCLLPGSCTERREIWLDNVAAIGPELTEAYLQIKEEFDDTVPVVVMPYPLVLTEDTCDSSPLDASEHEFIFEFTTVLNRQLATSASQAGVHFFADGAFALEGRRLCESDERAINLIRLQPSDGPLLDRLDPGSWTHNSMHPNRLGHRMIAEELSTWLQDDGIVGSSNPEPVDARETLLLDVRTARPHAVAPSVAAALGDVNMAGCETGQIGGFATRIAVFDEQPDDGAASEAFRVPVVGADTESTICVTNKAGEWVSLEPVAVADGASSMTRLPSAEPVAEIRGERVFVSGGRPDASCAPPSRPEDLCDFQWLLFAGSEDGSSATRTWSLRAVRYCSVDPDCEDTFGDWTNAQIGRAARRVAPTIGLIFLGGWLLALGIELVFAPRLARLVRRTLTGSIAPRGDTAG